MEEAQSIFMVQTNTNILNFINVKMLTVCDIFSAFILLGRKIIEIIEEVT